MLEGATLDSVLTDSMTVISISLLNGSMAVLSPEKNSSMVGSGSRETSSLGSGVSVGSGKDSSVGEGISRFVSVASVTEEDAPVTVEAIVMEID